MTSRGVRNNNPGNLRHSTRFKWQGETTVDEQGFVIFDLPMSGIRALARDLRNKIRRGLDTVEKILSVYAPPVENDTEAYIKSVCLQTGFKPNQELEVTSQNLVALAKAIIKHENGSQPYDDYLIQAAVKAALE